MKQAALPLIVALAVHGVLSAGVEAAPRLEQRDGLPVVYLEGTPYEIGRQHGELLRESVRECVAQVLGYFRSYLKVPVVRGMLVNWWLDRSWGHALPYIPKAYLEELKGLADGSGVSLKELWRLHAIPDRTYACSGLAVWGRATADGRLIHTRNLDWNIHAGVQRFATVFVVRPNGREPFVNVGWAGFIGTLTGVNAQQISIGQVGAETVDLSYDGLPMPFLMRRVLEEARSLDEAVAIIRDAPRTVGINYVVADAKIPQAAAIETSRSQCAIFQADDPKEHAVPYARPLADAVFRSDTAVDPGVRDRQVASKGAPSKPGIEPPRGSAYDVRYLGQAAGVLAHYGAIDVEAAKAILRAVAPDSNVQSVIIAWPELWVANADGTVPAAQTVYRSLRLDELLAEKNR